MTTRNSVEILVVLSLVALIGSACMKPNPLGDTLDVGETGGSCDDLTAFAPDCGGCLVDLCCEPLAACNGDDDCMCLASCLLAGDNAGGCNTECGAKASDIVELQPVLDCAAAQCESDC